MTRGDVFRTVADARGAGRRPDLRGANLVDADLRGVNLVDADLRGADLRGADLAGAEIAHARFADADLAGATWTTGEVVARHLAGLDRHAWVAVELPSGWRLRYGCEEHPIESWPHYAAATEHYPGNAAEWAARTRAVEDAVRAFVAGVMAERLAARRGDR